MTSAEKTAKTDGATTTDVAASPDEPKPGLWQRFRQWLGGTPPTNVPAIYTEAKPGQVMTTPSLGDAFDFAVRIRWVRTGARWSWRSPSRSLKPTSAAVWEEIAVTTRCVLRSFPPHQPAEAEAALNGRLAALTDGRNGNGSGRWAARAEVSLHDDVRSQQQEAWLRRLRLQADHEMASYLVRDYEDRVRGWRLLLGQIGIDTGEPLPPAFIGRYLVRLAADPESAAQVVEALSEHRESKDRELLDTVVNAVQAHDKVNLLETDLAYDSALRRLMDWAGLPMPELTERPLPDGEYR